MQLGIVRLRLHMCLLKEHKCLWGMLKPSFRLQQNLFIPTSGNPDILINQHLRSVPRTEKLLFTRKKWFANETNKFYGLTFMGPCIVNVFFKYNQQDATLYNIFYYCQCCTCFRRFLRPSSGAQNCTHSIWYMSSLLAATASGKTAWNM